MVHCVVNPRRFPRLRDGFGDIYKRLINGYDLKIVRVREKDIVELEGEAFIPVFAAGSESE